MPQIDLSLGFKYVNNRLMPILTTDSSQKFLMFSCLVLTVFKQCRPVKRPFCYLSCTVPCLPFRLYLQYRHVQIKPFANCDDCTWWQSAHASKSVHYKSREQLNNCLPLSFRYLTDWSELEYRLLLCILNSFYIAVFAFSSDRLYK